MKKWIFVILGSLVVLGFLVGTKGLQIQALIQGGEEMQIPPTVVASDRVRADEWQETLSAVGSLEAVQGVTVQADSSGKVVQIEFEPGTEVEQGDLLVVQDTSTEEADLRAAQANISLAQSNLQRVQGLLRNKLASQAQFDAAKAEYDSAVAQAEGIESRISKKKIVAPFSGELGIRQVNLGEDLNAGSPIVSLQQLDQIFVNFSLPQRQIQQVELGYPVEVRIDSDESQVFSGRVSTINPELDSSSRTVEVQAILENKNKVLRPGMFARVRLILPQKRAVLLVPVTAVSFAAFGDTIYVVEAAEESSDLVARQQFVRLGETRGDYIEVIKGLEVDQEIVSAGGFKLRNGAPVLLNNEVKPDTSLNPNPNNS